MKISTLVAALSAVFSCAVIAQTERELDSHEHGHALLNVAIDSELLSVELETPWDNLVGFEHKPGNNEQQALVDNALANLNDPTKLFDFVGAQCTLIETMVENSASDDDHHDEHHDDEAHKDEEHDAHGHDDEAHKDEEHDEHKHDDEAHHDDDDHHDEEHADHDDDGETHSEIRVSYSFECDDINKLEAINVKFFGLWAGFEELDAQLIGPGGQAAAGLTRSAIRLDVSQVQ